MDFKQELLALYGRLMAKALAICLNATDAEDLTQATMLRCLERETSYQSGTNLFGWAATIMKNIHLDRLRKKTEIGVEKETLETLSGGEDSGDALRIDIIKCLKELAEVRREVILLNTIVGKTAREISEDMSISLNTILSHIARGRLDFSNCMTASESRQH